VVSYYVRDSLGDSVVDGEGYGWDGLLRLPVVLLASKFELKFGSLG
jgi:hypothetical protein